jgi:hypothetical protein
VAGFEPATPSSPNNGVSVELSHHIDFLAILLLALGCAYSLAILGARSKASRGLGDDASTLHPRHPLWLLEPPFRATGRPAAAGTDRRGIAGRWFCRVVRTDFLPNSSWRRSVSGCSPASGLMPMRYCRSRNAPCQTVEPDMPLPELMPDRLGWDRMVTLPPATMTRRKGDITRGDLSPAML